MGNEAIFRGLNPSQRRAVEAVSGPVCIVAGAGSGKTTTITRRIANQVASGAFAESELFAVTFTDKAAGEMRARLTALGVAGVRARTFHAAALAQLRHLAAEPPGELLSSKAMLLRQIGNGLPKPYRFRPAGDLASEIEWAKNRRLNPGDYASARPGHAPPIPLDLMVRVYREYERRKERDGKIDFEDLLELAIRMFDEDEDARERFRARYRAFTVDEYQDVNLLQQSLLDRWLGERDDLCVVGDDYQSIYSFTGASPAFLLDAARRARAIVVKLEQNYRSTPEILELANRLTPSLGGMAKVLGAVLPSGAPPECTPFASRGDELNHIVMKLRSLQEAGTPWEEMAILYRVNFRSEDFEEALLAAAIPYQVRDGAFVSRPAARRLLAVLTRQRSADVAATVRRAATKEGWLEVLPDGLGEQETTRQNDLARLVQLAEQFDGGSRSVADFVADVRARFGREGDARGVNLLTYHRAKGLEFDAVFLPRLEEGEMPFRRSQSGEMLAEERRLLYVGMTRARKHLTVTWSAGQGQKPSRFLEELGVLDQAAPSSRARSAGRAATGNGRTSRPVRGAGQSLDVPPAVKALRAWRLERARADGVPAYVVLHDRTLEEIARLRPDTEGRLAGIAGIGPAKLERYGKAILAALAGTEEARSDPTSEIGAPADRADALEGVT